MKAHLRLRCRPDRERPDAEIKLAGQQGTDATAFIVAQTNMKNAQQTLIDQSQLWGNEYTAVMDGIRSGFQYHGDGLANDIIAGKSFHDTMMNLLQDLEKEILQQVVGVAFKASGTPSRALLAR